jgi:AcrR family transcriptional regulator
MDNDEWPVPKPIRGRPRKDARRQVVERLLQAAELLLQELNHVDLTERKIAAAAETSEAMIHYYFGDKDGLLFAVIVRYYDDVSDRLKALDMIDPAAKTITRDIFNIMMNAYYHKPWIARIMVAEFARGRSAIKAAYMKKFGPQGFGLIRLQQAFDRLIECGVYDRRVNATNAALGMFSMITGPIFMAPLYGGSSINLTQPRQEEWIDYVADLFDCQLRKA